MPGCVLKDCREHSRTSKKSDGLTFHRFLRPGHEKRETWIKFVQNNRNEDKWLPTPHTYICSLHFKDEDKHYTTTGRVYLKKTAVPYDKNTILVSDTDQPSIDTPLEEVPPLKSYNEIKLEHHLNHARQKIIQQKKQLRRLRDLNRRKDRKIQSLVKIIVRLKNRSVVDEKATNTNVIK